MANLEEQGKQTSFRTLYYAKKQLPQGEANLYLWP